MKRLFPGSAMLFAAASAGLSGCNNHSDPERQPAITYASHEPGTNPAATNAASFSLLAADGPARLEQLRYLLAGYGKQCNSVVAGMLVGGLDGTDEWRVKCADGGAWTVWFRADGNIDFERCGSRTADCRG